MSYITKTSLLVPTQLPKFISENGDYQTFVLFLQAYYDWMEQQGGAIYGSKNIPNYFDIDNTLEDFLKYYRDEFLTFFPSNAFVDQRKLTKIAKELYQAKGNASSFKFLFRVLYNTDVELYNSKDYVLRASDGKWTVTRSLTLATNDPTWLNSIGYKLFGQTSKGYCTIENVIIGTTSIQIILSNIQRDFISGEFVTVVDVNNNSVLFNNSILSAQILGELSGVIVDPANNGTNYSVGDPVVFFGGLNPNKANAVGASAYISQVTGASITKLTPTYRGQGYRPGGFTTVSIISGSGTGSNAAAVASTFDANTYTIRLVNTDTILPHAPILLSSSNYQFANLVNANANTKLSEALSFPILTTYGIASATVTSGGSGYDSTTYANATGYYATDSSTLQSLPNVGILAPITILSGGSNYAINDRIVFSKDVPGLGAYANVTSVSGTGAITSITYVSDPEKKIVAPLGGMGYRYGIPTVTVNSSAGTGASIVIPGLVGGDALFNVTSTSSGQLLEITITNPGQDYVSAPGVSLRVEDLLVYNVNSSNPPKKGDVIYQGTLSGSTFTANVDSIAIYSANTTNPFNSNYNLRVYNYNGLLNLANNIYIARNGVDIGANLQMSNTTSGIYTQGRKIYGNGAAKATAKFINKILLGSGFYQNSDGHPSAYSVLENENYNNYSYILQLEKALSSYKDSALAFLHPLGLKYNTYNLLKNNKSFNTQNTQIESKEYSISPLSYYIENSLYIANISPTLANTIVFSNISGANIAEVLLPNSTITITPKTGHTFYSKVISSTANTVTMEDNWTTTVPNVAIATAAAGSSLININTLTNAWNIATGNIISRVSDFINIYDSVSFDGVTFKQVTHVDQPNDGSTGLTILVNSSYGTPQSGYLTLTKNVISSNVLVGGVTVLPQVIVLYAENNDVLITEDGSQFVL